MTIYWSYASIDDLLGQVSPSDPVSVLGTQEQDFFDQLRFEKRRNEWLAGRLALKSLLIKAHVDFAQLSKTQLQILKAGSGAPYLMVGGKQRSDIQISLSHSNGRVFYAFTTWPGRLGVDLEMVEGRSDDFIQDYFTNEEAASIAQLPQHERAFHATLVWSAKEAVLKALALGLKIDTRKVQIEINESVDQNDWKSLVVKYSGEKNLRLYWRREGQFVLTACIDGGQATFTQVR